LSFEGDLVTVGSGFRFSQLLPLLPPNKTVMHGQCLEVGVAGYSIHGGVHFGSLSEQYGLAAHNIAGMELVRGDGKIINIKEGGDGRCSAVVSSSDGGGEAGLLSQGECEDLLFSMRGTGSSFAVVTLLTLKVVTVSGVFGLIAQLIERVSVACISLSQKCGDRITNLLFLLQIKH
jgi:hypothetical protein